jgi:hypothetical protein
MHLAFSIKACNFLTNLVKQFIWFWNKILNFNNFNYIFKDSK